MEAVSRQAEVSLREITRDTLGDVLRLNVGESQQNFVASNAVSIAEAYFEPRAWLRAIYAGERAVGFLMTYENEAAAIYYLWRFMIDPRFQGMGFGRQAMELLIERIKGRPGATGLTLSVVPGEGSAVPFYEKLGFVDTGRVEDGEMVFHLAFATEAGVD